MVPNRLGELTSLVPIRLGAETSKAESSRCRKTSVNRQNAVAVVVLKESCPSDYLAICWGASYSSTSMVEKRSNQIQYDFYL